MDATAPARRTPAPPSPGPRRIGIEIEFLGPSAAAAAGALARELGGAVEQEDAHAFLVRGSRLGDLAVDLDLRYVHPQRHPGLMVRMGAGAAASVGHAISPFVPRELITGPLAIDRLPELDDVLAALRRAGARGRGAVLLDSLGLHLNIDPPDLETDTVTALLKAFMLLTPWLRQQIAGGSARLAWVLPSDYPDAYVRQVLAPDYWPDLPRLTADYLAANPTRRRALDLLPLLAYFDEASVRAAVRRAKVGRRAVMHYRLPLAHVGDPAWSILPDWERWLAVERLAADRERLDAMGRAAIA